MMFLSMPIPGRYVFELGAIIRFATNYNHYADKLEQLGCQRLDSESIRLPDDVIMDISLYCNGKSKHAGCVLNIYKSHNKHVPEFKGNSWYAYLPTDKLQVECRKFERI